VAAGVSNGQYRAVLMRPRKRDSDPAVDRACVKARLSAKLPLFHSLGLVHESIHRRRALLPECPSDVSLSDNPVPVIDMFVG